LYDPGSRQLDVSGVISQQVANQIGDVALSTFTTQGQPADIPIATFDAGSRKINVSDSYHSTVVIPATTVEGVNNALWNLLRVSPDGPSLQSSAISVPQAYFTANLPTTLGGFVWLNANSFLDQGFQFLADTRLFGDELLYDWWNDEGALYDQITTLYNLITSDYSDNAALMDWRDELTARAVAVNNVFFSVTWTESSVSSVKPVLGTELFYRIGYDVDYLNTDPNGAVSEPFNIFLTQLVDLVTELQAAHDSLNPNDLLDTAGVFSAMSGRIASLEAELDVLTDQIEEASSAPTVGVEGGVPLIPNVVSQNDNVFTRAVLAQGQGFGDRTLDSADVRSASTLANQLEFLTANGVALDGPLVRQILSQFHSETQSFVTNSAASAGLFASANAFEAGVSDSAYTLALLLTRSPFDFQTDGNVGSADLLELLQFFGDQAGEDYQEPITPEQYFALTDAIAQYFNEL
jgi:hypothetical protein